MCLFSICSNNTTPTQFSRVSLHWKYIGGYTGNSSAYSNLVAFEPWKAGEYFMWVWHWTWIIFTRAITWHLLSSAPVWSLTLDICWRHSVSTEISSPCVQLCTLWVGGVWLPPPYRGSVNLITPRHGQHLLMRDSVCLLSVSTLIHYVLCFWIGWFEVVVSWQETMHNLLTVKSILFSIFCAVHAGNGEDWVC